MNRTNRITWLAGMLMVFCLLLLTAQGVEAKYFALGDMPLDPLTYKSYMKVLPDRAILVVPAAYDARDEGIVTSPKDQGYCGSCWAFASVGAMESHLLKAFGLGPLDLAEQQQNSCNSSMYGCCGGDLTAPQYWENVGPIDESCFSYDDYYTSCPVYRTVSCGDAAGCEELNYRVVDWHTVSESQFKDSLYSDGPSYWRYDVYSDFYDYWDYGSPGAVYTATYGTFQGGHAVLLIGWDDAKGAYLCKNSWGANDGPNNDGTFWIAYSGHAVSLGFQMSNFSLAFEGCTSDAECDDGEPCTTDRCDLGQCLNEWPACGLEDGCCPLGCDGLTDPDCPCGNGICEAGEDCDTCPLDCISGQGGSCDACFKGVCNGDCHPVKEGPDCADCSPGYCCGDGTCEGAEDSYNCEIDCGPPPVCGDGSCSGDEDQCTCPEDCGIPPSAEISCGNGIDDDCDAFTDCDDLECIDDPGCICLPNGSACTSSSECCSNKCAGKKCR